MVAIAKQRIYEPARARSTKVRLQPASPPPIIERVHTLPPNPAALDSPTPAEEAAWQLLKTFISPIDCNVFWQFQDLDGEIIQGVRAMNLNATMNALLNGEAVNLAYFTKKRFLQHCRGEAKYYYRSRWNAFACSGYGSHDNAWKQLNCDARCYALDGKKLSSENIALLLLGLDVDAHNGEKDVPKTTDLILDMFPGSYHEPSTNGLGEHIYVKIYYDIHTYAGSHYATLHHLHGLCSTIADGIESKRKQLGYDSALDRIRGLPSLIGFVRENNKPVMIKRTLNDGTVIEKPRLKVTCRSLVIKVPFYRNCNAESVFQFFEAPYFSINHLEDIRLTMLSEGIGNPEYYFDDYLEKSISEMYSGEFEAPAVDPRWDKQQPTKTHNSVFPATRSDYKGEAQNLATIQDSHARRIEFGMLFARHLGRAPTGHELEMEYTTLGLSKPDSKSDRTSFRFEQISRWLSQSFDTKKCRFGYGGYTMEQNKTEAQMAKRVTGIKLDWSKGNGHKPISVAKLAALYWCMRHSQGRSSTTHYSRQQAKSALLEALDVKCHNAEVAAMLRVLEDVGLIGKVGGYCPGHFGREWIVSDEL